MERFTKQMELCPDSYCLKEKDKVMQALQKLGKLEDAESEGRLHISPLMTGDKIYCIHTIQDKPEIFEYRVNGVMYSDFPTYVCYRDRYKKEQIGFMSEIGHTIFTSFDDAKAAISPLNMKVTVLVKFNRPVNFDLDLASTIDSFTMTLDTEKITIACSDATESICRNKRIICTTFDSLEEEACENISELTIKKLRKIKEINDVHIFVSGDDLCPVSIEKISFSFPYEKWSKVDIPKEAFQNVNFIIEKPEFSTLKQ